MPKTTTKRAINAAMDRVIAQHVATSPKPAKPQPCALVVGGFTFQPCTLVAPMRDALVAEGGGDTITLTRKHNETVWRFTVDCDAVGTFTSRQTFTDRLVCAGAALRAYRAVCVIH